MEIVYKPPFVPIEISVDTHGDISISAGSEIVTAIGTFSVNTEVASTSETGTLLIINHNGPGGRPQQDRFEISATRTFNVCLDGSVYGEFGERRITLNAFAQASTIRIVEQASDCPKQVQERVQPVAQGTFNGYEIARIQVGSTSLTVLIADTEEKISTGIPGVTTAQLGQIDGMLYLMPKPTTFDPATNRGQFIFPGYLFAPEIHFFDANATYWAGGPAIPCASDGHDCIPYYASLYDMPVPYQYGLELVRGRLGSVAVGTPLIAIN